MPKIVTPEDAIALINGATSQKRIYHIISTPAFGGNSNIANHICQWINEHYDYQYDKKTGKWLSNQTDKPCTHKNARDMVVGAIIEL